MARPKGQKSFAEMLQVAIKEAGKADGTTKLRDIADKLVAKAVEGDMQAIKEIADRLDGKAMQQVQAEHTGDMNILFKTIYETAKSDDG